MNRMRFGAVLVADGERTGFYLSHRAVLTVPSPGRVRAVPMEKFSPRRVFVRNGVAVACFEAMLAAAETTCSRSARTGARTSFRSPRAARSPWGKAQQTTATQ